MQSASPATARPGLPTLHHARIPSLKSLFASSLASRTAVTSKSKGRRFRRLSLSASAATSSEALEASSDVHQFEDGLQAAEKQLGVVVMPIAKPRLVLRFIWMEKNLGLALDQVIPGHGTIPLSPYYFWPRKDAWEELKTKIEEKPWISQKRMIILLNQATDIINLWQQSGSNL
ncbi:small ribosomal subunit protein cS23-like isoform X2 [Curcuma longa]|uniref:small ribosomal subunit protein cS23-like isoform X2 n=1 Tax=Curcuma longa TaxID=136217 RepID=UPI003D9E8563